MRFTNCRAHTPEVGLEPRARAVPLALQPTCSMGWDGAWGFDLVSDKSWLCRNGSLGRESSSRFAHCDFVAGAKGNEIIEGTTTITRKTRSLVFVSGELAAGGRTVLTATGIWKILGAS